MISLPLWTFIREWYSEIEEDVRTALTLPRSTTIVKKCLQGDLVKGRTVILVVSACFVNLGVA